jgi:ATP-dependent DNA helicase DinG
MSLPSIPFARDSDALIVGPFEALVLSGVGEVDTLSIADTKAHLAAGPHLICHEPGMANHLRQKTVTGQLDVLDLFAFVHPAQFCLPTPQGLAEALTLSPPGFDPADQATTLILATVNMLDALALETYPDKQDTLLIAQTMARAGWAWGPDVVFALSGEAITTKNPGGRTGLNIWQHLPEWEDEALLPPPDDQPVKEGETLQRLASLLGDGAEDREPQRHYAADVTRAFRPREVAKAPNAVLAEAGTGVGKTLGYVAAATLWAEKNGAPVWLSTYTKNLQRQIDQELDRRYPDRDEKAEKVVVRKGRENYLCLLNLEEAVARAQMVPENLVRLGLVARWARYTRDGDMAGGDLPGWLLQRLGTARASGLTDRRGECVYAGCTHWRKCFIEHSSRKARYADLVVANHALVMVRAARYGHEDGMPTRYVFDEGHHIFDAADSAFSSHLTGLETSELRRWIRGGESARRSRARGLETRVGDLVGDHEEANDAMMQAIRAAAQLPGDGWLSRVAENNPVGSGEKFLATLRAHVHARSANGSDNYSLEAPVHDPADVLLETAQTFERALQAIGKPLQELSRLLKKHIADHAETLDSSTKNRLDAASEGVLWRVQAMVLPWKSMLHSLQEGPEEGFVDWFALSRAGNREIDCGMHRHWIDPTEPFARSVLEPSHGVVVTSATLRDEVQHIDEDMGGDADSDLDGAQDTDWSRAEMRTGFNHLALPARRSSVASPFNYPDHTRVIIVNDVNKNDPAQVASAYRALFIASGGGALGLFTAIARLRGVYSALFEPLAEAAIPLYAQHVDALDPGTLVDIFRADEDACLLGTDAVRDGVDVPGSALRLIVFDRVPWPRPTIIHRARRSAFGDRGYDDMIARLRLKQAFGRLVRRADDKGIFVMLDSATPSRLLTAFPPGVCVDRIGLKDAVATTQAFFDQAPISISS